MKKYGFALLIFLVTCLLVGSIFLQKNKETVDKVTIAEAQQPGFALVYIAEHEGYFKDEGLDVSYRKFTLGKDALNDTLQGKSDLATVFETPVVRRIYEGKQLSVITTLHNSTKNTGLIILKNHGISEIADLRGKKIGVPKGTNPEFFLYLLLAMHGITQSEVRIVDMPADKAVKALQNGSIDAASLYNPFLYRAQKSLEKNDTETVYSDAYTETSMLVGTRDTVLHNQKKMIKLLKALKRAEEFTKKNKKEALAITDTSISAFTTDEIVGTRDSYELALKLDNKLLTVMDREAQFFQDIGVYSGDRPNMREHIEIRLLRAVKPDGVTLY